MILRYRRVRLANKEGDKREVIRIINHLLNNEYDIIFLPSGSSGVFLSMFLADKFYIPDMGGWEGFLKYPKVLNKSFEILKTNFGIIDLDILSKIKGGALLVTSLAGYLAEQPLKEIRKICNENEILFIEDISGKIGGDCGYGDVIICSTGSPKILNCGYGGFLGIAKNSNLDLEKIKEIAKTYKTINYFGLLKEELIDAEKVYKTYIKANYKIKKEIDCYFKEHEGLSIFIECDNPKEKAKEINSKIMLDNFKSLTTICPNYNRLLKKGIVFETKKIDYKELEEDVINYIITTLA
ncbi:hypothetical protein J422_01186 [Methanocaldococcus villosus KIN24-T80]|uniref:DegT/DnrJ/EryC1/StrS aminotransferase n=1 Tax=Methanocaldococcus villosus KIN24-T80 TaxID=1069083 RepID=N6V339_9EURY|nr:hypothetical protein [Methanocaldococcus villosus]ENN96663.1 hypothetical protein J422_01186 [Methanocaldococcus villosus KIN24-T80]